VRFEVHGPGLTLGGRVVFVEMGFVESDDLGE
jgi:hypothetical protein